jgi:hypothetical protein
VVASIIEDVRLDHVCVALFDGPPISPRPHRRRSAGRSRGHRSGSDARLRETAYSVGINLNTGCRGSSAAIASSGELGVASK